jgi:NTE family protein
MRETTDAKQFDAVFEGGGVKGVGLVGALSILEQQGYTPVNVAGTSAGAIVASLLAAGYQAAELKEVIMGLDFNQLTDPPTIGRIPLVGPVVDELFSKGLYKGDYFLKLMRDLLARKGVRTFGDLVIQSETDDRYRFKLRVVASDISLGRMLVLPQDIRDYGIEPGQLEVALAVRMSMSIPLFFCPVQLKRPDGGTSLIVDGGLLSNFPVELFDSVGDPSWPTFGFKLVQGDEETLSQRTRHPINGPLSEVIAMFLTATEAHDAYYLKAAKFVRTIAVDTLTVASTDFNLSPAQKEALYQSGMAAANDFLAHWNFDEYRKLYRSGEPVQTRHEQLMSQTTG